MGRGRKGKRGEEKPVPSRLGRGEVPPEFIEYYRAQLVPHSLTEEEFTQMLNLFKVTLPHVFRISPIARDSASLTADLEKFFDILRENNALGPEVDFLSHEYGRIIRLLVDRPALRKTPALVPFQHFLTQHSEAGDIHRQELVSMIPPYFLDVHPDHLVLDMCAAPGSKTSQIIEMMLLKDPNAPGLVVANDVEPDRCRTLIHQTQRFGAPHVVVTNYGGQNFPSVVQFDRVLCDVICSGDGTFRKNTDAAEKWRLKNALGIHPLQISILKRGLELLKKDDPRLLDLLIESHRRRGCHQFRAERPQWSSVYRRHQQSLPWTQKKSWAQSLE